MLYLRQLRSLAWVWGGSPQAEESTPVRSLNTNRPLPILPPEIVELIVIYLSHPLIPPSHAPYNDYFRTRKEAWKCLEGVASSTKYYRHLLVKRWFSVIVLQEASDWGRVLSPAWLGGLEPFVSMIITASSALVSSPRNRTDTSVLASFGRLTRVTLDYHNDFLRSKSNYPYYKLVQALPRSLEFLEILNAHGPDEHIIRLARSCPDLTELRLGRCTMFSNQNCVWWKAHPADHDAYMADRGVEAYAGAVGNLIDGMAKLQTLHIGVYLTPIEAVWAHRVDHRNLHPIPDIMRHENPGGVHNHLHQVALATANGEDPEPPINYHYPPLAKQEIWEADCPECERHFRSPAENAEMRTACVLSARVWSLRTVSFASFTSRGRVGASSWEVRPKHSASGALLTGEDAHEMLPRLGDENPPIRYVEVEVGRSDGPGEKFVKRKALTFGLSTFGNSIAVSPPINEPRMSTVREYGPNLNKVFARLHSKRAHGLSPPAILCQYTRRDIPQPLAGHRNLLDGFRRGLPAGETATDSPFSVSRWPIWASGVLFMSTAGLKIPGLPPLYQRIGFPFIFLGAGYVLSTGDERNGSGISTGAPAKLPLLGHAR
ncbi:hypothetical protein CTheo_4453 [Ceratobasidium theobromae]|uniref:Uncharacterized protein n=1 Tax=Ceratobasidium theobromae TaxID=1582974 RepID=A0A5N5QKR3_9AGAM|nr:hypothetical protein CTheo_4453 [Ceratobasidium theobromae]